MIDTINSPKRRSTHTQKKQSIVKGNTAYCLNNHELWCQIGPGSNPGSAT